MGTWGTSLYSGDYAADLRSTIGAIMRLPNDGDELLKILVDIESDAAEDSDDEDHTIFWLVTADIFLKKGVFCPQLTETALKIIDSGQDLAMMESLGMDERDLKKRAAVLSDLRTRLTTPPEYPVKERKVMKKPLPYLMEVGDCYIFPTAEGESWNPYVGTIEEMAKRTDWKQDGWGIMLVVDRGKAFDYLPWYRPLVMTPTLIKKPTTNDIFSILKWELKNPGTLTSSHFKRLKFEKLINLPIDIDKWKLIFPKRVSGFSAAIQDISIGNSLIRINSKYNKAGISNIKDILVDEKSFRNTFGISSDC